MSDDPSNQDMLPFVGEPADTRERIMQATFETIQEYGFAGLSIQRIAENADLSKSSFYHFFDDKDDLLLAFLDAMLEQFGAPLSEAGQAEDPEAALWAYVDFALYGLGGESFPPVAGAVDIQSGRPYVELRSQGTYDEDYRERFTDIDMSMRSQLAAAIERGIEQGTFREVDPDRTAEFLLTVMLGALFRRATADAVDVEAIHDELETIVRVRLLNSS
ncbi:MAG: AcrR family transcriptional regulator [Halobacteriales archaeon]|jgi:AcrR family transcriptional regulator